MTCKFKKIGIRGYRRLFSVNMEMRPLSVMIGANGVGKTSLLEVFSLLAASADGKLRETLSRSGGLQDILTCGRAEHVTFQLSAEASDNEQLDYDLTLRLRGISYEIASESLIQRDRESQPVRHISSEGPDIVFRNTESGKPEQITWEHSPFETSLSQSPRTYGTAETFRKRLASCTHYSAYSLDIGYNAPIRLPQKMQPATHPGANGEDLISCLYYLRETERDRFEAVEDTLAVAFPGFRRLNFPPVAAGTLAMTYEDSNFSKPLYMNQLSEGTLRFLWLITLLESPDLTGVTLIDEPEVSLHPQLLSILPEIMREASERTQLIVTTHSGRFIRFLKPPEVLVLDAEEGLAKSAWADTLDLDQWLREYELDELWVMGRLGGKS
ncbi:AAA family ATPase [Desulfobacterales bacterium HSG2]|nr:AAA family ATPase [Desulfobacterales bacterium HSG2]